MYLTCKVCNRSKITHLKIGYVQKISKVELKQPVGIIWQDGFAMSTERRNYPKVSLQGDARILLAGIVRNGKLIHMTPAGVEIEIRHQLVEQLNRFKSDEGLFPDFEVEFEIPCAGSNTRKVSSRSR